MTFEMFGAGCFGAVIGFVAWQVVRAGEASFDVKQLAAFIGALLGAVVLSAFPAGTIRGLFVRLGVRVFSRPSVTRDRLRLLVQSVRS